MIMQAFLLTLGNFLSFVNHNALWRISTYIKIWSIYILIPIDYQITAGLSVSHDNGEQKISDEKDVAKYLEATYIKPESTSCQRYQFGMMHGNTELNLQYVSVCLDN